MRAGAKAWTSLYAWACMHGHVKDVKDVVSIVEKLSSGQDGVRSEIRLVRQYLITIGWADIPPLGHRVPHGLPRRRREHPAAAKVRVALKLDEPVWVLTKHLRSLDAAADNKIVATPAVVGALAVGIERPAELGRDDHCHAVPHPLVLQLGRERREGIVDLPHSGGDVHGAVCVEPADLGEKGGALGPKRAGVQLNDFANLLELKRQPVVGWEDPAAVKRCLLQLTPEILGRGERALQRLREGLCEERLGLVPRSE